MYFAAINTGRISKLCYCLRNQARNFLSHRIQLFSIIRMLSLSTITICSHRGLERLLPRFSKTYIRFFIHRFTMAKKQASRKAMEKKPKFVSVSEVFHKAKVHPTEQTAPRAQLTLKQYSNNFKISKPERKHKREPPLSIAFSSQLPPPLPLLPTI